MNARVTTGFDRLAPVYDTLAGMIFGQSIRKSQTCFLAILPAECHVLILGGGTGWFLAELLHARPRCTVCYIEASAAMISRAKEAVGDDKRVFFIHGTQDDIPREKFDVIVTHFFLDLFSSSKLPNVIEQIAKAGQSSVLWLVADFNEGKKWQKTLLKLMYLFFRITCGIDARSLPPWGRMMEDMGAKKVDRVAFYKGFIESIFYTVGRV